MLRPFMGVLLLLAAAVSGTAALVAEVVWFRGLGRGVGTSAEALAVVSASFLGGLGIGAAISARLARRVRAPLRAAAICEALAGLLVIASPFAIALVPDAHLAVLHALGLEPAQRGPPRSSLPVMASDDLPRRDAPFLVRSRVIDVRRAGRWTGWLYGVSTLGAAAGVALAVTQLLPGLGEIASLRYAGCGNLFAALCS
jgi:hypothetical protein